MDIKQDYSLRPYNTFGIGANALYFADIRSVDNIKSLNKQFGAGQVPILILGGGSNVLFTKNFDGLVLKDNLKGINVVKETAGEVWVKAAAGEIWNDLVQFCISNNYGGIENLSLIPGTVGAAPMQNIGAYGVELKDVFDSLEALDMHSLEITGFDAGQCRFGYRDSVFKQEAKGRYFIVSVTLRLQKDPRINATYGAIQKLLDERGIVHPTIADVGAAVSDIRRSKLPDPALIGNAGSFFKNPEIIKEQYQALIAAFPDMPGYPTAHGIKLSAAWLIEQCGWKGKRVGDTGTHVAHALVLVNYGDARGADVIVLAREIQQSVAEKFRVHLDMEVNIV